MEFSTFAALAAAEVRQIVQARSPLGVGIPFNGTRRWYLATFQKSPHDLYTEDYPIQVFRKMRELMGMMFADGIHSIYTPILGRDLAERGAEYMQFANLSTLFLAHDEAMEWYKTHHLYAGVYGDVHLLSSDVVDQLAQMSHKTRVAPQQGSIWYGAFADNPLPAIIQHTLEFKEHHQRPPSPQELIHAYYGGEAIPVDIWIGSDQPTIFDVPMLVHGSTALYFLQFPTPYLTQHTWRRILYDVLFVRGDQETLYPENIRENHQISGLGVRKDGYWSPTLDS